MQNPVVTNVITGMLEKLETMRPFLEEGCENFDFEVWLNEWLNSPIPALGGQKPIVLLDSKEGQEQVAMVFGALFSDVYV